MTRSDKRQTTDYSADEATKRFESALRGARLAGRASPKTVTLKKEKGKPAKTSPSSGASRASAKTEQT